MEKPKLRREVEAFPVDHQGQRLLALRDTTGLSQQMALLSGPTAFLLNLLDGEHTLQEIQVAYTRQFGTLLLGDQLRAILEQLDACLLLDSPRYRQALADRQAEYAAQPERPSLLAGRGYPGEPAPLRAYLGDWMRLADGRRPDPPGALVGLAAPHIDLARGGRVYARTYQELLHCEPVDLYVLLGTCHTPTRWPFALTRKGYRTPLGTASTDRDLVDRLVDRVGPRYLEDDFSHRGEHSLEFQVLFLQYLLGERAPFQILPILCGCCPEALERQVEPREVEAVRHFLEGLREVLGECGRSLRFIAGVDLSHVGPHFGDPPDQLSDRFLAWVEREDRRSLSYVCQGDASGFYRSVVQDGDRRRVCGLFPLYAMLEVMEAHQGRLLDYAQCVDAGRTCCVTVAGVAFYRTGGIGAGEA